MADEKPILADRIAGDAKGYTFALVRVHENSLEPTDFTFGLPSVSDILDTVLGKPAGAMSHWGYNLGIDGCRDLAHLMDITELSVEGEGGIKDRLKQAGYAPNRVRDRGGDKGNNAHKAMQLLAKGFIPQLDAADGDTLDFMQTDLVENELVYTGEFVTIADDQYVRGVIGWFAHEMEGWRITECEIPVWSFRVGFSGTLDFARERIDDGFLEIVDLKTHKPATQGFPAYNHDVFQLRLYRIGWKEVPHTQGIPDGNRVLVVDAKGRYFTDTREVSEQAAEALVPVYYGLQAFEEAKRGAD